MQAQLAFNVAAAHGATGTLRGEKKKAQHFHLSSDFGERQSERCHRTSLSENVKDVNQNRAYAPPPSDSGASHR